MAKKTESVPAVQRGGSLAATAPEFMRGVEDHGTDLLKQFIVPPRMKIVQPQASSEFKSAFNEGDCILMPSRTLLAPMTLNEAGKPAIEEFGTSFFFVPVFFFPEWCKWNPLETKGALPVIRERSLDPRSRLAALCKNEATWYEKCPERPDKNCRNVEHLNFLVMLVNHPTLDDLPFIISFSKGSYTDGSNLANFIQMRKAPMYGCVFEGHTKYRKNEKGEFYGLPCDSPSEASGVSAWITDEARFKAYQAKHNELKEQHKAGLIRPEYDEDDRAAAPAATSGEF